MKRFAIPTFIATAALLSLAACGTSDSSASSKGTDTVDVVASTNVWGDVVKSIGGDHVDVTSLITSPDQDPHEFEASTQAALDVSKAQLIVENGGGYDDYMAKLRKAHNEKAPVIDAVEVSGAKAPAGGELNEHIWYSPAYTAKVADDIATQLSKIDPDHASDYSQNAKDFQTKIDALDTSLAELKTHVDGKAIAITEPVPLYLTSQAGLVNKTPEQFSEAVEEGGDISPAVLNEMLQLFNNKQVSALVYNNQTSDSATEKVKAAATDNGIAVVGVTETLPKGKNYFSWMQSNIDALHGALVS